MAKLNLKLSNNFPLTHIRDVLSKSEEVISRRKKGEIYGYKTGWKNINNQLGGCIYFGTTLVIGARPGVGKTTLANILIKDMAILNKEVSSIFLYFNFEMANYRQGIRFYSNRMQTSVLDLLSETPFSDHQTNLIKQFQQEVEDLNIFFIDIPITPELLWKINEEIYTKFPHYRIVNILDHTRLTKKENEQSEEQKLSNLMSVGQECKKRLESINIFLSQLNRNIEQPERKKSYFKPMLSDLFGADSVGQYADIVLMPHRPEMYGIKEHQQFGIKLDNIMLVETEKNRDGETGTLFFKHNLKYNDIQATTLKELQQLNGGFKI